MRIAFVDFCGWDFHVESVDLIPMGGSQSAACHLARCLAAGGHEIFLVSNVSSPGLYAGVNCLSWRNNDPATLLQSLKLDALICILAAGNGVALRNILGPKTRLILWNQHAHDQGAVQPLKDPQERAAYSGFAMVSDWQTKQYQRHFEIDRSRMKVLRNAIAPAFANLFPNDEPILPVKAIPPVLAYTSTPFRGLDLLLDTFGGVRNEIPRTRLRIYSSMKVYQESAERDEAAYGALYQRCRQTEGVEYVGSLPQPELARELRHVAVLAYPNTFAETSCIAVMEATAAGCTVVTSRLGALPETGGGFARLVSVEQSRESYIAQFVHETIEALRALGRADETEAQLRRQVATMNSTATWPIRAREWLEWLETL